MMEISVKLAPSHRIEKSDYMESDYFLFFNYYSTCIEIMILFYKYTLININNDYFKGKKFLKKNRRAKYES